MASPASITTAETILADRLARCAPSVRATYQRLDEQAAECFAAATDLGDRCRAAERALTLAASQLAEASTSDARRPVSGGPPRTPTARTVALTEARDRCREQVATLHDARARLQERSSALAAVRTSCRQYLLDVDDPTTLEPVPVDVDPAGGIVAALAACRQRLTVAAAAEHALRARPRLPAAAHADLDALLDAAAADYTPPVDLLALPAQRPLSGEDFLPYKLFNLLAGLPAYRALLHARLDAAYTTGPAPLADAARTEGLRTLATQRLTLERDEAALVLRGEQAGLDVTRRADADPAVVLTTTVAE